MVVMLGFCGASNVCAEDTLTLFEELSFYHFALQILVIVSCVLMLPLYHRIVRG